MNICHVFSPDKDPGIVSHTTIAKTTTIARVGGKIFSHITLRNNGPGCKKQQLLGMLFQVVVSNWS